MRDISSFMSFDIRPDPREDMVWIPSGVFSIGSDYGNESPVADIIVNGFWMDRYTVTNRAFSRFVEATNYRTIAERWTEAPAYHGAKPDLIPPSSMIYRKPCHRLALGYRRNRLVRMHGADWRHPRGPGSSIAGMENHPVVHIAFEDAEAYASWTGKELPTEAEWEFAARGGVEGFEFSLVDDLPVRRFTADVWPADTTRMNRTRDGHRWTLPVGLSSSNAYGLYDMAGNVWQWTSDWYQPQDGIHSDAVVVPRSGAREGSYDPQSPLKTPRKVIKGGSHLCAPDYSRGCCWAAARLPQSIVASTCDLGFRCVVRGNGRH